MEQEVCRSPEELFRLREVFNTDVENFVKKGGTSEGNSSFFNGVMRFAQFLCKRMVLKEFCDGRPKQKAKCFAAM